MISSNQEVVLLFIAHSRVVDLTANRIASTIEGIGRSAVYEAVGSLQEAGLIEATWNHDTGRGRRLLEITASGRKALSDAEMARERVRAAARRLGPATA